jgi:hypothetical protein
MAVVGAKRLDARCVPYFGRHSQVAVGSAFHVGDNQRGDRPRSRRQLAQSPRRHLPEQGRAISILKCFGPWIIWQPNARPLTDPE